MNPTERAVLGELEALRAGTTMCAGALARRVLPDAARPLEALRPTLASLEAAGAIALSQRGRAVRLAGIRGPFRVARARDQAR